MKNNLLFEFTDGRQLMIPRPGTHTLAKIAALQQAAARKGPETAVGFLARLASVTKLLVQSAWWSAGPAAVVGVGAVVDANKLTLREARHIVNACLAHAKGREPGELVSEGESQAAAQGFPELQNLTLREIAELVKDR